MRFIFSFFKKIAALVYPPLKYMRAAYSQEGEDLVLLSYFEDEPQGYKGFYVDIGAHHPYRFSNTYIFYNMGWHGLNIDASPGSMKPFRKCRKRDINLELGIGAKPGTMTFYCFNEPALNTFDKEIAMSRNGKNAYEIISETQVEVRTLEQVLDAHVPPNTKIDFLTLDAEGFDFVILASNNWKKYKPGFIVTEIVSDGRISNEIVQLLSSHGYRQLVQSSRSSIFKLESETRN
jgi:FkbM family methyltransferase